MFAILLIIVTALIVYLYNKLRNTYNYWNVRNVEGPKPHFFVGNNLANLLRKKSIGEIIEDAYKKYERYPFVGMFQGLTPQLLVRDPDLVRNIAVKDFKCFVNNDFSLDKEMDPIAGRNPFFLKDDEWRTTRQQISPFFTSAKMKGLVPLLEVNQKRLAEYIKSNISQSLEGKSLCSKFTLDNVASCAFGIDGKAFVDEKSEFGLIAKDFIEPSVLTTLKMISLILFPIPILAKILRIKLIPTETENLIIRIVNETLEYRKKNNITRADLLNMLQAIKNQHPDTFTDYDMVGHAGSFISDGFATSASAMSMILFNLAQNQEAQSKLREEIKDVRRRNNGEISYDAIRNMKYLDACVNESLRVTPPLLLIAKTCNEDYEYTPTNTEDFKEVSVKIEKGTSVFLPLGAFATDAKYFPEPEKYKPERFLEEDKLENLKYVFFPFGNGPRACLGQAFGVLQLKVGVIGIVESFIVKTNAKTKLPLTYDPWNFIQDPVGGLWFDFEEVKE